jgi:hypothetical protein
MGFITMMMASQSPRYLAYACNQLNIRARKVCLQFHLPRYGRNLTWNNLTLKVMKSICNVMTSSGEGIIHVQVVFLVPVSIRTRPDKMLLAATSGLLFLGQPRGRFLVENQKQFAHLVEECAKSSHPMPYLKDLWSSSPLLPT